jgi:Cu(I)/Ag(I) efflux system membrane fusion protein
MKKILLVVSIAAAMYGANYKISTIKAKETTLSFQKEFFAKTSYKESSIKDITLKFSGYVEKIYVNEKYQSVKKGSLILEIYSPEILALKEELIKTAEYAEKSKSFDDDTFSKTAAALLETAKQRLLLLGVSKSEIERTIASKTASRTTQIYSPYYGIVVEKSVFAGSFVEASKPILKLADTSSLWAEVKIYESDIPLVKKGATLVLNFAGAQKSYKAKIEQILPQIDDKDRSLTARATISNDGSLVANMFAKAKIEAKSQKALILPKTAVLDKGKKQFVFVKTDKKFEPQEVIAKKIDANNYMILDGLSDGDEVANDALFLLDSDAKINGLY